MIAVNSVDLVDADMAGESVKLNVRAVAESPAVAKLEDVDF